MNDEVKNKSSKVIWGILIGIITILAPIFWDWWSKKSELSLIEGSKTILVEKKTSIDGLTILYNGKNIESLSKILFTLKNTGRTAIVREDLSSPPTIIVESGEILNYSIETLNPANLESSIFLENKSAKITFPLLNPNDAITFGFLVAGDKFDYSASARIKNISELKIVNEEDQIKIKSKIGVTTYIVGFFTFIFIIVFGVLLFEVPKKNKALKSIKENATPIKKGESVNVVKSFIENDLSFLTTDNKNELVNLAEGSGEVLTEDIEKNLLLKINKDVSEYNPFSAIGGVSIFIAIGIYYLYRNIFS